MEVIRYNVVDKILGVIDFVSNIMMLDVVDIVLFFFDFKGFYL